MTDDIQQPIPKPEPQPENLSVANEIIPPQSKKSKKKIWFIVGIVFGVLILCSIICVASSAFGIARITIEKAPIESVLDSYMKFMAVKDVKSAYALFSARVQRQVPISNLQDLISGNNQVLWDGYRSLSINNIKISAITNADPNVPQGIVANVNGVIAYEGGFQGTFNGILEKVNGKWQIDGISVTVPPNKFQP